MTMNFDELFNELFNMLPELVKHMEESGYKINVNENENGFTLTASKQTEEQLEEQKIKLEKEEIEKQVNEFKKYVQDLDDNIFILAVEEFDKKSPITIKEFTKICDKCEDRQTIFGAIKLFKDIVGCTVQKEIDRLTEKYL